MRFIKDGKYSSPILGLDIAFIAEQLKAGKVIAFPTDTVYGLACVYDDEQAINKIKQIKGRPDEKAFPMMVSNIAQLENIAILNQDAKKIVEKLTPGALTLIVDSHPDLPEYVNNGLQSIAFRIPGYKFNLDILEAVGKPLLVTSANRSGLPSVSDIESLVDQIYDEIDYIVASRAISGVASTIIDVRDGIKVVRQGEITLEKIMEAIA